jgi:Imelysin
MTGLRRGRAAVLAGLLVLCLTSLGVGCGGDDDDDQAQQEPARQSTDLTAVKAYLLDHTAQLKRDSAELRRDSEAYYRLARSADFDYARLLEDNRAEVRALVRRSQDGFARANPAYEEMEGVVAGVPELADFDVSIDAGGDASDPENAVPFSLETPAGRTFKQPGNFNFLIETSLFGTEPKFAAKGVEPDLDGDGQVEFGEALPDADFYVTAAREFERTANELDEAARAWKPTTQDALTALVVMTPTMSEYFEAWKNSRFVAGSQATEKAFVVASRLQDITDILGGLLLVYDNVKPAVASADRQQARQTEESLRSLHAFARRLRDQERGGKKFDAQDADTLGSEAQSQAEAIAGQISQAASQLNIKLET